MLYLAYRRNLHRMCILAKTRLITGEAAEIRPSPQYQRRPEESFNGQFE